MSEEEPEGKVNSAAKADEGRGSMGQRLAAHVPLPKTRASIDAFLSEAIRDVRRKGHHAPFAVGAVVGVLVVLPWPMPNPIMQALLLGLSISGFGLLFARIFGDYLLSPREREVVAINASRDGEIAAIDAKRASLVENDAYTEEARAEITARLEAVHNRTLEKLEALDTGVGPDRQKALREGTNDGLVRDNNEKS